MSIKNYFVHANPTDFWYGFRDQNLNIFIVSRKGVKLHQLQFHSYTGFINEGVWIEKTREQIIQFIKDNFGENP